MQKKINSLNGRKTGGTNILNGFAVLLMQMAASLLSGKMIPVKSLA
jgi:hypothetical protein